MPIFCGAVRRATGKPPLALVHGRLVNEAKGLLTGSGMQAHFGMKAASHARGLRLHGIVFTVDDSARCEDVLTRNCVEFTRHLNRLVVAPADGQGAIFAFEETGK